MSIVENIDRYCARTGITVKEFERMCGIANATVHKWRVNLNGPSFRTISKISKVTGISMDDWTKENGV